MDPVGDPAGAPRAEGLRGGTSRAQGVRPGASRAGGLRTYEPARDRAEAHEILRRALLAGPVPYTVHPGDWDWWCYHGDPRLPEPLRLIGDDVLVWLAPDGELSVFGLAAAAPGQAAHGDRLGEVMRLVSERAGPDAVRSVGWVSHLDERRERLLREAGFAPTGSPMTVFRRPTDPPPDPGIPADDASGPPTGAAPPEVPAGAAPPEVPAGAAPPEVPAGAAPAPDGPLPPGFVVRPLAGLEESAGRADAARLAFASTMPPPMHRARYRRFMLSPAYAARRDLVAVTGDGEIAAFAIFWPDHELGLGQLEPVGTRPSRQGRGLARAVVRACLRLMAEEGIGTARVCTEVHRTAAQALYRSCGFVAVDALRWWSRG